ncbi:MAG: hypothetical protein HDT38_01100 [Clostridiales bacterium]|nr:hypothetical protein [Clostridiales bacterium]
MINLKVYVDQLCGIARQLGNDALIQPALFLRQRIYQPDGYVVLLGESCCGKSTVLNSIIRQNILPVSSLPSTGAITEVFLDRETDAPFYAVINRNATMETLTLEQFRQLSITPDAEVARLRATLPSDDLDAVGVQLFDTPGYGSLIAEHEEVLEEFLPSCDSVAYLVNYRTGIQQSDHEFLRMLMALSRPGIPFCLVINRAPAGAGADDRRVKEIKRHAAALLTIPDLPLFIIPSTPVQEGIISTPELDRLRTHLISGLRSEKRQKELYTAFLAHLQNLAVLVRAELERRTRNAQMDAESAQFMRQEIEELQNRFQNAIDEIVLPGFQKIRQQLPGLIHSNRKEMEAEVCSEIAKQGVTSKEETIAYTNSHLLPFWARKKSEDIQHYLTVELNDLDKKVDDYLNTAVIKFERDIQLHFSSTVKAGAGVAKGLAEKLLNGGLIQYFLKYGGRGGAGAGIANAASHALKQIGGLFGHTFSSPTHNALKHFMSKVGLTSVKTLGAATAGVIEVAAMGLDGATWKPILEAKIKNGLKKWETEANQLILTDLDKLKVENIETINSVKETLIEAYAVDQEPGEDIAALQDLMESLTAIEKELCQDE